MEMLHKFIEKIREKMYKLNNKENYVDGIYW